MRRIATHCHVFCNERSWNGLHCTDLNCIDMYCVKILHGGPLSFKDVHHAFHFTAIFITLTNLMVMMMMTKQDQSDQG